jgi:succinylglutamate desuccinylase
MTEKHSLLARVDRDILRFDQLILEMSSEYLVETLAPRVHILRPRHPQMARRGVEGKDVELTIAAVIHGVEVAGLAIVVELLELIKSGEQVLEMSLGLTLGNIPAAQKGVRFVERDLNRSFGRDSVLTGEDRRADELERLFGRSRWLVDFHQVKLRIDRPFWIFPYTKDGYDFARAVAPDVSLVTHWGRGFSQDGQCSDEWLNHHGGNGVTMELGQNGFDPEQITKGLSVARRAISVATAKLYGRPLVPLAGPVAPIYTWGEIIAYPPTGAPVLDAGWHNFRVATAGERLGFFGGQEISATVSGPVLFPKYPDMPASGSYGDTPPAAELIRVLKVIEESDLPKVKY